MKPAPRVGVRAAFIQETDERAGSGDAGAVVIARVADPSKLLDGRSRALHKDVVEMLVDLAVALLDGEDDGHAEDPNR